MYSVSEAHYSESCGIKKNTQTNCVTTNQRTHLSVNQIKVERRGYAMKVYKVYFSQYICSSETYILQK